MVAQVVSDRKVESYCEKEDMEGSLVCLGM